MIQNFCCSSWCSTGHEVIPEKIISTYRMSVFSATYSERGGATGVSVMGSHGKYQMGGGGQRHALLLFCGKSPKLGNGTGKYLFGKGGVGHEFWVRPAGEPLHCYLFWLSDADGDRAVLCCFLAPLLSFHYSRMDYSYYYCSIFRRGRSSISRHWKRLVVVESPCLGTFASISEELCVSG
ncbi:hypothetical protein BDP81DRAFT_176015 [Colletotrichum phormii]|uniref:Uncharacterized protein n=1 Tax=Colletotrichum phormii TaxID=359342 RepID=A0AAJ0EHK4_9PEZI|nr:uncharacterized protein BDP81DRAFT_176015 [Colletotrichum phormii]KAK1639353.1 hypothetical protein BDP81DRAFT_176015 [Colletotrichum phormii]